MHKNYFITACIFAVTAVMLGALGAHALKEKLDANQLTSFETGVRYQLYHALAMLLVSLAFEKLDGRKALYALRLFSFGILFFSVSIYLLSMKNILHTDSLSAVLGPLTPFGGTFFIAGWIVLLLSYKKKTNE